MNLLLFIVAGLLCVAGALGVILAKQPVHQVLAMILNFIGLAALYMSLSAEFMALIQMIVYGGAVMVLFLFVIALLTARKDPMERDHGQLSGQAVAGWSIGGGIALMLAVVGIVGKVPAKLADVDFNTFGTVKAFGMELLTTNLLPFELTAFVLMVAVIGVVILVGRQKA
ncbi:MAG TPA: NADH-quinone oxidoreductase subunit J [Symbiobacteriaceae bacterium]|jgi:NADH-quinone oxidoreductase subunit J|nr:NADH-quinone oxidoreductase subunit J [Symbiobacteriaceae bacterium]